MWWIAHLVMHIVELMVLGLLALIALLVFRQGKKFQEELRENDEQVVIEKIPAVETVEVAPVG